MKFFICEHCKNVATKLVDKHVPLVCCGEKMKEIDEKIMDGATEKHLPVYLNENDNIVIKVGEAPHPMTADHLIEFLFIKGEKYDIFKRFLESDIPEVRIANDQKILEVYAYCNLHGLWKIEV